MFKIFIKNLKLFGYHGVNPEEKKEGQYFVFNIEISISKDSFKGCDDLSGTVNYSEAVKLTKEVNSAAKYDLLETLAEKIAIRISIMSLIISGVKVRVEKIRPPINEKLESVGVEFELEVKNKHSSILKDPHKKNIYSNDFENNDLPFKVEKVSGKGYRRIYLSIGTNKGNRLDNIKKALKELCKSDILSVFEVSSIYETEPMYVKNQDNFYNLIIKAAVKESLNPFEILGYLKSIEYEMGRENQVIKNGPRIIDIDILSIEDIKINSDILKLPHPGLPERNFVLVPLSEIEPDYKINGVNINEFIKKHKFEEKVTKVSIDTMF
jgi:dihydroneopterin aldolase / 2-amino-4-hydroxy-6-hydroxymethyldihydropteridine diphosphokinase